MARWLFPTALAILFLAGLLVRGAPSTPYDAAISAMLIVLLALPSYLALVRSEGAVRGLVLITGLSLLSMAVEAIGVLTGLPYGWFAYSSEIGTAVIGPVPWTVGFAYVPLLLGGCALASRYAAGRSFWVQVLLSSVLLVAADLVLDPGAALLGYWIWAQPGLYYGIPASNFAGWLLTGAVYSAITLFFARKGMPVAAASSYALILAFWTGVSLGAGMVVPAAIGFALLCIAWRGLDVDHAG
jgi:putative membrane protein